MLVSLLLCSNRPAGMTAYLDRLEAMTDEPSRVEVVVKTDRGDAAMAATMARETARRPFRIVVHESPKPAGFHELWRFYDALHGLADPDSEFVAIHNDEVGFASSSWDSRLANYVGFFPDRLFRLRVSRHRLRNYFDAWECGFAPDSYAFATRRWIDAQGSWAPCEGPDTFQQLVAFHLARADWPAQHQINRDIAIHDIALAGEEPLVGLDPAARWRRVRAGMHGWRVLVSHRTQEEALRRARIIEAHIRLGAEGVSEPAIADDRRRRRIVARAPEGGQALDLSYRLPRLPVAMENLWKSSHYFYYGGGGPEIRGRWWRYQRDYIFPFWPPAHDRIRGLRAGIARRLGL